MDSVTPVDPGLVVLGPTAVGKSGVAMVLAQRLKSEIVSIDSMQVYRGLDIGTDKPSPEIRAKVTHHLVDVVSLQQTFDVAQFVRLAGQAVTEMRMAGKQPISCGGTGFYLKAWVEGLGSLPPSDPELRAALEQTPLEVLLEELKQRDPQTYERLDRDNPRRVIRAVEALRLTGEPLSGNRASWKRPTSETLPPSGYYGLIRPLATLDRRIESRVERMFQRGLVEETKALLEGGLGDNPTARQAIGYRQVIEFLEETRSLKETVVLVENRTRQFARRQLTWFRNQMTLNWVEVADDESDESVADRILLHHTQGRAMSPG